MEIILYVDENGTQEGDCNHRAIDISTEDEQSLLVIIGHSLSENNKFERVEVLYEKEYQEFIKIRNTHPDYKAYIKAREIINDFERMYR